VQPNQARSFKLSLHLNNATGIAVILAEAPASGLCGITV